MIGLMEWREKESRLMVKRGKKILLRVSTLSTAVKIKILAENKWKQFHPDLYDDHYQTYYNLLYESGKEIVTTPGSEEPFVLYKYQHDLQKDYKRITLFLCKSNDLRIKEQTEELSDEDVDENNNEDDFNDLGDGDRTSDNNEPETKGLKVWKSNVDDSSIPPSTDVSQPSESTVSSESTVVARPTVTTAPGNRNSITNHDTESPSSGSDPPEISN